jgi:hypothetical protein
MDKGFGSSVFILYLFHLLPQSVSHILPNSACTHFDHLRRFLSKTIIQGEFGPLPTGADMCFFYPVIEWTWTSSEWSSNKEALPVLFVICGLVSFLLFPYCKILLSCITIPTQWVHIPTVTGSYDYSSTFTCFNRISNAHNLWIIHKSQVIPYPPPLYLPESQPSSLSPTMPQFQFQHLTQFQSQVTLQTLLLVLLLRLLTQIRISGLFSHRL